MVLEHRFGAVLLASLLLGDPLPELGDNATPVTVLFQASAFSPVDDLVVVGREAGDERRVSIGVRRTMRFAARDVASVGLIASFLRIVHEHWAEVATGEWRLALATASRSSAHLQISDLAEMARHTPSNSAFRDHVTMPGRTTKAARARLLHFDAMIAAAIAGATFDNLTLAPEEVAWRLLSTIRLRELRLEGKDDTDRTTTLARLRAQTPKGTAAEADVLFSRLAELSGRYAPAGAIVNLSMLRRDLRGVIKTTGQSIARQTSDQSPYHPVGTLPPGALTYIRRNWDEEATQEIDERLFVSVTGRSGIGKSSLLVRLPAEIGSRWNVWYQDCTLFRGDSLSAFMRSFFRAASKEFGKVSDFSGLGARAAARPTAIILDEFGSLRRFAPDIVPGLYAVVTEHPNSLRLVVGMPWKVAEFLHEAGVDNPKHVKVWREITAQAFEESDIIELMRFLPAPIRDVAIEELADILRLSSGNPREVQSLCHTLYSAVDATDARRKIKLPVSYA